ncbi:MAG: hypothetical protein M3081_02855 [Gemmatimonadota bacterium]|nr:hypothetical protein [Gemmatimonadota bacterium]
MIDDATLQHAYRRALAERDDERASCPAPETIAELVEQRGEEQLRLRTLDHVMGCERCRQEFELLRALRGVGRDARQRVSPQRWAIAAALVVAVGGALLWRAPWSAPWSASRDVVRGGAGAGQLVAPSGEVDAVIAREYTWHSIAGAASYTLEVTDTLGEVRVHLVTHDTTASAPPGAKLVAEQPYVWSVTASRTDGSETRMTPTRFIVRAR